MLQNSILPAPIFNKYWNTYTYFINGFCIERHGTDSDFYIHGNYTFDSLPKVFKTEKELISFVNNFANVSPFK